MSEKYEFDLLMLWPQAVQVVDFGWDYSVSRLERNNLRMPILDLFAKEEISWPGDNIWLLT